MKGISALIRRATCTTSQVLVSRYSFNPSVSISYVRAPSELLSFVWATATEAGTAKGSINPKKPMCEDMRSS